MIEDAAGNGLPTRAARGAFGRERRRDRGLVSGNVTWSAIAFEPRPIEESGGRKLGRRRLDPPDLEQAQPALVQEQYETNRGRISDGVGR